MNRRAFLALGAAAAVAPKDLVAAPVTPLDIRALIEASWKANMEACGISFGSPPPQRSTAIALQEWQRAYERALTIPAWLALVPAKPEEAG